MSKKLVKYTPRFKTGEFVFAYLKGFPYWPGRVSGNSNILFKEFLVLTL